MAFPKVVGIVASRTASDSTSHTVNLPAFLAADDILLSVWTSDSTGTVSYPGGWTLGNNGTVGGEARGAVAWMRVVGDEGWDDAGNTISVTTANSDQASAITIAIRGAHTSTDPAFGTQAAVASSTPDPNSLDPSGWATEETLWLVTAGWDLGTTRISDFPSGWGMQSTARSANSAAGCGVAVAALPSEVASIDPGVFTFPLSSLVIMSTIGVRPVDASAEPSRDATPTISAIASEESTAVTSHPIEIPDTLAAGDILCIEFAFQGGAAGDANIANSPPFMGIWWRDRAGEFSEHVWYRVIDATEGWGDTGNTVTVTTTSSVESSSVAWRIRGAALPIATVAPVGGNDNSPNPASLDPPFWGTEDALWVASCAWDVGTTALSTYPTDYSTSQVTANTGTAGGSGSALAARANTVSSENPGTFTIGTTRQWLATTYGFLPAEAEEDVFVNLDAKTIFVRL